MEDSTNKSSLFGISCKPSKDSPELKFKKEVCSMLDDVSKVLEMTSTRMMAAFYEGDSEQNISDVLHEDCNKVIKALNMIKSISEDNIKAVLVAEEKTAEYIRLNEQNITWAINKVQESDKVAEELQNELQKFAKVLDEQCEHLHASWSDIERFADANGVSCIHDYSKLQHSLTVLSRSCKEQFTVGSSKEQFLVLLERHYKSIIQNIKLLEKVIGTHKAFLLLFAMDGAVKELCTYCNEVFDIIKKYPLKLHYK